MVSLIAVWFTSIPLASTSHTHVHRFPPKLSHSYVEPTLLQYDVYDWVIEDKSAEVLCLAKNIYFEGRNESLRGQAAIGLVTINRVKDDLFPTSICGVVFEKGVDRNTKKTVAQFSWTLDGKSNNPHTKTASWRQILRLAQAMTAGGMFDNFKDFTNGATHYHANYIDPKWTKLKFIMNIDTHRFYRA